MNGAIIPTEMLQAIKEWGEVLIPDEWGNHSDLHHKHIMRQQSVLIPDEWGNHSDFKVTDVEIDYMS